MILALDSIELVRDGNRILNRLSLEIPQGEFFVLMGPTGCGKTTTLRVAGLLEKPDTGAVLFHGKPVPSRGGERLKVRRMMATMFQSPVMFRGSVEKNIELGLRIRGVEAREITRRVGVIMELTGISHLAHRDASTLSGGERRRTALARAMVLEPDVLILDEPTTSLHLSFKTKLLEKIKELHANTSTTFVMATHDFEDALAVGTSGAVMNHGKIEQSGSLDSLLFTPDNAFMAEFSGAGNILPAVFHGSTASVDGLEITHTGSKQGSGFLSIPPEVIVLSLEPGVTSERNRFKGTVKSLKRGPVNWTVSVDVSGTGILLDAAVTTGALDELSISAGSRVCLSFKASAVHLF